MSEGTNFIVSPLQGTVLFVASAGAEYSKGSVVITLESMKMQHDIFAEADGAVSEVLVQV